jgi:hypothetical protein
MMRIVKFVVLLMVCALAPVNAGAQTPDYAREQRIADEIVPAVVVGDPVRLAGPGNRSFLGIYTGAPHAKAAVILVHGMGVNPDWGLLAELRSNLADAGYSTLSIQMPVLPADAKADDYAALFPEAAQRIASAVEYLNAKDFRKIVLVSHSLGSRMSNEYVVRVLQRGKGPAVSSPIAAWVAIGMPEAYRGADLIRFPVFDLYGENDLPVVLATAAQRRDVIAKLRDSRSLMVPQADHYFNGHYPELDKEVRGFLDQVLR